MGKFEESQAKLTQEQKEANQAKIAEMFADPAKMEEAKA